MSNQNFNINYANISAVIAAGRRHKTKTKADDVREFSSVKQENRSKETPYANYVKTLGLQLNEEVTKKIMETVLSMFRFMEAWHVLHR